VPQNIINNNKIYAYFRYTKNQRFLIISNFSRDQNFEVKISIPNEILSLNPSSKAIDLLTDQAVVLPSGDALNVDIKPNSSQIIQF
jgi:hypothetical protein